MDGSVLAKYKIVRNPIIAMLAMIMPTIYQMLVLEKVGRFISLYFTFLKKNDPEVAGPSFFVAW